MRTRRSSRLVRNLRAAVKTALVGPQLIAFFPALTLGGYWYGGEGVLLFMALLLPALFAMSGLFRGPRIWGTGKADAITGLPLREAAVEYLDTAAKRPFGGRQGACIALRLDDAEMTANRLGPDGWDAVLARVGERLTGVLREGDLVARTGAASFAIVLRKAGRGDVETMIQLCARMQSAIAQPLTIEGRRVYVGATIGFCQQSHCPAPSGEAFLAAAETALAEAVRHGPGSIRAFSDQMSIPGTVRHALADEIEDAFDHGQITPWFQPQISTDTGRLTGVEALARWSHPARGQILPGEFLAAVEEAGLDGRLAETILFASLAALREWDRQGLTVPRVGVNIGEALLRDPRLVDKIRWELDRFDLAPERLSVEVLESVISHESNDVITRNLSALHDLGCAIDLDDFGTGHASITSIRRFAIDRIKIDRSFVTRIDIDREQQSMVAAILTMAEQLGCDTLAEGVETIGEHAMLAQLGSGHVQGFGIARPMPAEALTTWLRQHDAKLDSLGIELASDIAARLREDGRR